MGTEHFRDHELKCRCCGKNLMDPEFMEKLEVLRVHFDTPMVVTSAYRCPKHNYTVSTTGAKGPHTTGKAIDISIAGSDAHYLVRLAMRMGFTGIGINQKGAHISRFVHLDTLTEEEGYPRPRVWSY